MKTFFTADPHFGHVNMTQAGRNLCGRPFADVEEMNRALVDNFNSVVSSEHRLVILGDICMGKLEDSLKCLAELRAGELVLVPGNHDRWSPAYHHKGDAAAKREAFRLRYEAARPNTIALRGGEEFIWKETWDSPEYERVEPITDWDFCQLSDEWEGNILDTASFSHFPYDGDSHGEDRYVDLRPARSERPLIHGHVHGEWRIKGNQFNVGVDVNNFMPVSEEELADWVRSL